MTERRQGSLANSFRSTSRERCISTTWMLCAAIVTLAALWGCDAAETPTAPKTGEIRRVILISIDTLRADALGSYGNAAGASPNLDRFADQGVRFETCIAPAPMTLPSHATLLTGLHPLEHGLLVNAQRALAGDVTTLAETLQEAGWRTGAVVSSSVLHHRYGLDRGFSHYGDDLFSDVLDPDDKLGVPSANARDSTLAAINWISAQPPDERLFLFLHYIDPHAPYTPPTQFARAFPDNQYLAEIAYTDAWIGRLAEFLQEHDLLEDTLFVITSDHGEHLGDHDAQTHGYFLYDEVLRVPLIFAGGGLPGGAVSSDPVGLVDITPTILALLKLPNLPDLAGRNIFSRSRSTDRAFVSVSYAPALTYGWSPLWSLWTRDEKFILAPRPEYFRTDSDPGELEDLAAERPERARALEQQLRERAAGYIAHYRTGTHVGLDMATAQQLMALGYAAPSASAESELDLDDFSGRDPKDMREVIALAQEFHTAVTTGEYNGASDILDEIERLDPEAKTVKEERSFLFLLRGQEEELLEWLEQMPDEFRASATQRYHRAVALGRLDRGEEAMAILRATLEQVPDDALSLFELAKQLTLYDQPEEAMGEYRKLLEIDPRNKAGRLNYASLVKQSGNRHVAISQLRTLIEMYPRYAKAVRNLGLDLAAVGELPEAIAMLKRAIELAPQAANRARTEEIIAELRAIR